MKSNYYLTSSKLRILTSFIIVVFIEIIILSSIIYNYTNSTLDSNDPSILLYNIITALIFSFMFFNAFINTYFLYKLNPKARLEINNNENFLLYSNLIDNNSIELKINYDYINLIMLNKAKFINLSYYEVFYSIDNVKMKIIISCALTNHLEKKICKKIEFFKNEIVFFDIPD